MKRKNTSLLGNVLMVLELVVVMDGASYSILNQLPQFNLPQFFAHDTVLNIFIGGILWLAGVRTGRHEQISDRYWQVRHYDKRCHCGDTDHRHN